MNDLMRSYYSRGTLVCGARREPKTSQDCVLDEQTSFKRCNQIGIVVRVVDLYEFRQKQRAHRRSALQGTPPRGQIVICWASDGAQEYVDIYDIDVVGEDAD